MAKKIQRNVAPPRATAARQEDAGGAGGRRGLFDTGRVSKAVLSQFTTQLATLLEAGIPLVRCLRILEGQMKPGAMKRILTQVRDEVEGGTPFSEALAKHEQVFDRLYSNMIRAGEAGGIQDRILDRLSKFMEKAEAIKSRIKGALAYPAAVVCVAAGVVMMVMTFVVPEFKAIFQQLLGKKLPGETQFLLDLSETIRGLWWVWLLGIPSLVVIHVQLVRRVVGYRRWKDRLLLGIPYFGDLLRKSTVSLFARTFGTLIESGVPHLEALAIVKASVRNLVVSEAIDGILASIREGEGIARPMEESGIFDDLIVNMVEVGEQTGELDRMLLRIADRYEIEVDRSVEMTMKAVEVGLILVLAVVVGFIVYALLKPMLSLMQDFGRSR